MANIKESSTTVLNGLNSVMSALNYYNGDSVDVSLHMSEKAHVNMMDFLIDLFNKLTGPEWLTKAMSKFITVALPGIEYSMKGILLAYVESMLSCSVKPIITEQMIREGVYFNLRDIDLLGVLDHQPVIGRIRETERREGKYLYFGCDAEHQIYTIPDLVHCEDFNAVLWYAKNCPGTRIVWNSLNNLGVVSNLVQLNTQSLYQATQTIEVQGGPQIRIRRICRQNGEDENGNPIYYTLNNKQVTVENGFLDGVSVYPHHDFARQNKTNGIVTIEYNAKSTDLSDAENQTMYCTEPIQNCLHVFIGCCAEVSPEKEQKQTEIIDHHRLLGQFDDLKRDCRKLLKHIRKERDNEFQANPNNDRKPLYNDDIRRLTKFIEYIDSDSDVNIQDMASDEFNPENVQIPTGGQDCVVRFQSVQNTDTDSLVIPHDLLPYSKKTLSEKMGELTQNYNSMAPGEYPTTVSNYYYLHPLLEFNTDLIFSMKWFDEKVLTAQLVHAILGTLDDVEMNVSANGLLSAQSGIVQAELNRIIEKVIENEDEVINDCFFSFDNDEFNRLMQKTEMERMGVRTDNGISVTPSVSADDVLESINALPENATKEEVSYAIEHAIFKAVSCCGCKGASPDDFGISLQANVTGGIQSGLNITDVLVKKLTQVVVSTFLTPKIYMILMFNLKMLGQGNTPFNLVEYVTYCKVMFTDIINNVKNMIFDYLKDLIMEEINRILKMYKPLILQEQYNYYKKLITSCVNCLRIHGNEYDWTADDVRYADITEIIQSTNNEC